MRRSHLLALFLSALFFTTGCPTTESKKTDDKDEKASKKKKSGDDDDDDDKPAKKKKKGDDDDDDKPAKKKKGDDDSSGDEVEKVGIKECDDYIANMQKCIKKLKMPAEAIAATKKGLKDSAKAWKDAAKTPAAKDGLTKGCVAALKAAKTAYKTQCPGAFDDE